MSRRRWRRRIFWAWLAVACWAALVWHLGGDEYSATKTNSVVVEWLHALVSKLDWQTRIAVIRGVRKSAHFIEYAILAILAFRAALLSAGRNRVATASWVALFLVALLACADEARQSFSSARTGSPYDVGIDLLGGVVAVLGVLAVLRRLRSDEPRADPAEGT